MLVSVLLCSCDISPYVVAYFSHGLASRPVLVSYFMYRVLYVYSSFLPMEITQLSKLSFDVVFDLAAEMSS